MTFYFWIFSIKFEISPLQKNTHTHKSHIHCTRDSEINDVNSIFHFAYIKQLSYIFYLFTVGKFRRGKIYSQSPCTMINDDEWMNILKCIIVCLTDAFIVNCGSRSIHREPNRYRFFFRCDVLQLVSSLD